MHWRRLLTVIRLLLVVLIFIVVAAPEWPAFQDERHRLRALIGLRQFDFLRWEVGALTAKARALSGAGHAFLDQEARGETVLAFLERVSRIGQLRAQINGIYAAPDVADPDLASRELQAELAAQRLEMARLQPMAEAIVQEQISIVLDEEGFGSLGTVFPPVEMHMTPLPNVLIISPRDKIDQLYGIPLVHGLTIPQQEALEEQVFVGLNRSALVVPIGGLGMFPSMIVETSNVNFLADTVAHEWAHHWLTLRPLGLRYLASPQLRTINETVASIVGREIGTRVVERFYPSFLPPDTPSKAPGDASADEPEEPPAFDFRAEMHETRVEVDRLLTQGNVEEAEAYMEARRQVFVANGFPIRKLNQAYFAFYGAYADIPGAAGGDPVGPAVVALRQQSPSLRAFLRQVARVTSFEELSGLLETP